MNSEGERGISYDREKTSQAWREIIQMKSLGCYSNQLQVAGFNFGYTNTYGVMVKNTVSSASSTVQIANM